jgi:AraC-like DNA-binding protein
MDMACTFEETPEMNRGHDLGWSLARIADRLHVSPRTLVDWNRQSQAFGPKVHELRFGISAVHRFPSFPGKN